MSGSAVTPPVAMSVASTDSGGGAGLAVDLRTFAAHRVFGTFAVAAVTAQDTVSVRGVEVMTPDFLDAQLDAVLGDFDVVAMKTGMLGSVANVEAITARALAGGLARLVVDPVLVSSSGRPVLPGTALDAYRALLAHALVVTPNLPEAALLVGRRVETVEEMGDAARALHDLGVGFAVVKGGRLRGERATDVVFDGTTLVTLEDEMVPTANVHGTGCTLSAAITARLARGEEVLEAVAGAKRYVHAAIASSATWRLGHGHGPLDHTVAAD